MNLLFPAPIGRRFTIVVWLAVMLLCAAGAAARSPISLDVLQRDGYGSVELIKGGQNRLYVPAEINGKKIRLLLDTGWGSEGITVGIKPSEFHIVPEKGVQTILTASGTRTPVGHGIAQSVVMGNVQIQNTRIYFGRFSDFGFIGHGFLKRNSAIIDLTNLRLYLRPPKKGRRVDLTPALTAMGLAEAPIFDAPHGSFVLNVEVNGVPTQMALDTGAQISELDVRFAKVASTKGWGRRNVFQRDAAGAWSPADFAGTKTFKIEGVPIRTPTVFLARFAGYDVSHGKMVGVLGLDVIGLNWGIIDLAQQKFYFAKAN
jgi:predicted aspartyl protease